MLLASVV